MRRNWKFQDKSYKAIKKDYFKIRPFSEFFIHTSKVLYITSNFILWNKMPFNVQDMAKDGILEVAVLIEYAGQDDINLNEIVL